MNSAEYANKINPETGIMTVALTLDVATTVTNIIKAHNYNMIVTKNFIKKDEHNKIITVAILTYLAAVNNVSGYQTNAEYESYVAAKNILKSAASHIGGRN